MKRVLCCLLTLFCLFPAVGLADAAEMAGRYNDFAAVYRAPEIPDAGMLEGETVRVDLEGMAFSFAGDGRFATIWIRDESLTGDLLCAAAAMVSAYGGEMSTRAFGVLLADYIFSRQGLDPVLWSEDGLSFRLQRADTDGWLYVFGVGAE